MRFLPNLLLAGFYVFLLCLPKETIAAVSCQPDRNAKVTLDIKVNDIEIIENRSIIDLTYVSNSSREEQNLPALGITYGLAYDKVESNPKINYSYKTDESGFCLRVNEIVLEVTYMPVIYIAREYPRGSCHYNHVMKHELQHVAMYQDVRDRYLRRMDRRLTLYLKTNQVYSSRGNETREDVLEKMQRDLFQEISDIKQAMDEERDLKNSKIDSPESYKAIAMRIEDLCDKVYPQIAENRDAVIRKYFKSKGY